jgi:N-acetylglucosamine-6-phosphate deacetylase
VTIDCPGFVDLQVNGFAGIDFNTPGCTPDEIERAIAAIRATGVTRFLPTVITAPLDRFASCARALADVRDSAIAGIHMEGPYISPDDGPRGAHPRADVRDASLDDFQRRQEAARGRVVLVTLAPEVPGALELIERLVSDGLRVAIGHSGAAPARIRDAVRAGATLATHLGNGCSQLLPRHPNLIWEQLAADELAATLIVDGHHLPPATVKSMVRVKTPQRTILVTDAIAAAGCGPGRHRLGAVEVDVAADGRTSPARGPDVAGSPGPYLAGSVLTMPEAIANVLRFADIPLAAAIRMASIQPAQYLGIETAGAVAAAWDPEARRLQIEAVTV